MFDIMSGYRKEIEEIIDRTYHPVTDRLISRADDFIIDDEDFPSSTDYDRKPRYTRRTEHSPPISPHRDAEELRLLRLLDDGSTSLKQRVLDSKHPDLIKAKCLQMLREYEDDPENNSTAQTALQLILKLPTERKELPISTSSSYEETTEFLKGAWDHMQSCVYGQDEAKSEIIEYLVSKLLTPDTYTPRVLGLVGPPGVGKTSLAIHGIADVMGIPFYQISIGGLRDVTYFSGTMRCWKGAHQGKFTDILIKEGYCNPIIYVDELDKVSADTAQDIYGWLTHATDPNTNRHITDHYLGIDLDLSKVTFIFSYNDPNVLPPPLRDRIKEIYLDGFDSTQKINLVNKYIIPDCLREYELGPNDISFSDEVIAYTNAALQNIAAMPDVSGVRFLKKGYQSLIGKIMVNVVCNKESFKKLKGAGRQVVGKTKTKAKTRTAIKAKSRANKKKSPTSFMPYYRYVELPYNVTIPDVKYYLKV